MIVDILVLFSIIIYYIGETIFLGFHTNANTFLLIIALLIDVLIVSGLVFKMIAGKNGNPILRAAFIPPFYVIITFLINSIPALNLFKLLQQWQLIVLLLAVYAYLEIIVFQGMHAKMKVIKDRSLYNEYGELGKFPIYITDGTIIPERSRYYHCQILGPTGAGKTTLLKKMIYQDIKNKTGVFILDIKTDMREDIEKYAINTGRDLDYFRFCLGDPDSLTYNPLAGDDASEIANRVFTALYYEKGGEQYYIDIARRFLFSVIAVLKKKFKTITFKYLYMATSDPSRYLKAICLEMKDDLNARYLLDFIKAGDIDKKLTGLLNKLAQFAIPEWTKQINPINSDIDISEILTQNRVFLYQANPLIYMQEYKPLSVMLMMHITSEIGKRVNKENRPFFMYLDEFYNILYPDFTEIINKVRSLKVGIIFGHQTLSDLRKFGKDIEETIVSNSRCKLLLTIEDSETADFFAQRMGTVTVVKRVESYSTKDGVKQAGYTLREEEQYKIHPNDFKHFKIGDIVAFIPVDKGKIVRQDVFEPLDVEFDNNLKLYRRERKNQADDMGIKVWAAAAAESPVNIPEQIKGTLSYKDIKAQAKRNKIKETTDLPGDDEL